MCILCLTRVFRGHSHRQQLLNLFLRVLMCFLFNTWMILFHRTYYSCALAHTRTTCPTIKLVLWMISWLWRDSTFFLWWVTFFFSFVFQSLRWSHSIWCWFTYGFFSLMQKHSYIVDIICSVSPIYCFEFLAILIEMFSRIFYFSICDLLVFFRFKLNPFSLFASISYLHCSHRECVQLLSFLS